MKKLMTTVLLAFIFYNTHAQVQGFVRNNKGETLPAVNISLLRSADGSVVASIAADSTGFFLFDKMAKENYMLRISAVGYETWYSPSFEPDSLKTSKDFGTLVLKEDRRELQEVVVKVEKPLYQQKPEGMVVNVQNSVMTKGSSVLEVLERSPGVAIDRRNSGITLNGKNGVLVLINGKPMRMAVEQVVGVLAGMSANEVERIELLTAPPAGYDAEGSAGIINIVLKKSKRPGTNGAVSVTGGYGRGEKATASVNLAHNTDGLGIYGSYSFSHDRTYSDMQINSSQVMPVFGGALDVLVWDTTKAVQNNHDANVGADIKIDRRTTIGGSMSFNNSSRSTVNYSHSNFTLQPDSLLFFKGIINGEGKWSNLMHSIYAERKLRDGEKINLDIDYLYFKNQNPSIVQSSFLSKDGIPAGNNDSMFSSAQRGLANTNIRVAVAKLDYTKQLSDIWRLETGIKGTYTSTESWSGIESLVNGAWVNRNETVSNVSMKEGIGAAYAAVNAKFKSAYTLAAGVRYEYAYAGMEDSQTKEPLLSRKQGVWFPNVSVSKKLDDRQTLQLSWNKRISRPSYNDLASFIRYSDPTAVYTGNTLLKATITHNLNIVYNYRKYNFSLSLSRDKYPIARYQITESPQRNLLYVSPQNMKYQNTLSLQTSLPIKLTDWWNMQYNVTGSIKQFRVDHTEQPVTKTYFSYATNFSQSFALSAGFSAELSGWYNSWLYNGSVKVGGMGALNAGIKKELQGNRGSFQLSVTDMFRTMHIDTYYGTLTQEAFSIKNHVSIDVESSKFPIFKLSYTRSFGTAKSQRKQETGSKEERDRIRND